MFKKVRKLHVISFLIVALIFSTLSFPIKAKAYFETSAHGAIIVDADTGKVLYEKNSDSLLYAASMSKMMAQYIILEAVSEGKISWDQEVPVSDHITNISKLRDVSNVPLSADQTFYVRELYESITIYSASAATMALAELIAGSYPQFVDLMNKKAEELGMGQYGSDFIFYNSTGVPNNYLAGQHPKGTENDENLMTPRATAILSYRLITDYPEILETASVPVKFFKEGQRDETRMDNWNKLLPGLGFHYEYADGLKTGTTGRAGRCFAGTAFKNGQRLITVVMKTETDSERFGETIKLMDYGFNNFSTVELLPANYQLEGFETLPVVKGKEQEVAISTNEPLSVMMRHGEEDLYSFELILDENLLDEAGNLVAPIEKGQKVGIMKVNYDGESNSDFILDNGYLSEQVDVVINDSVEKAGWFSLTLRAIGGFFSSIWTSVSDTVKGIFS